MMKKRQIVLLFSAFFALAFAMGNINCAEATEAYQGVGNYDPALIDQTNLLDYRQMEEKEKFIKARKKTSQEEAADAALEEELKKKMEKEALPDFSFQLNKITIEQNTVYKTETLMKLIQEYVGKEVKIEDLILMSNKITDYYQNNGYLSTIAYIPPQRIKDGEVVVVILEGKYGKVNIEGNKWAKASWIKKRYLDNNYITEDNVLNVKDIRTALREINAEPYIKKGEVAIQDSEYGEEYSEITLNVKDRFPADLDIRWDNQGRSLTGLQRLVIYAGMYNLTGFGDQLLSTTTISNKAFGQGIVYSVPIADQETKFNIGYTYTRSKIGGLWEPLNIIGQSHDVYAGFSRRLFKTDTYRLYGDIAVDLRNTKTTSDLAGLEYEYKTRAIRGNLTQIRDDMYGKWLLNTGASVGIPLLDATNESDDIDIAGNNFAKFNANLARLQVLPWRSLGIMQLSGQFATRALFPSEKMSLGGIASVRGYEESFAIADNGFQGSFELRTPVPLLRKMLPEKLSFVDDSIRLAAFYDFGVFNNSPFGENKANVMMSVGGGMVIRLSKYVSGNFYLGIPIANSFDEEGVETSKCRFHFTLTSNIL